jgi:pilus assembly protein CpaC
MVIAGLLRNVGNNSIDRTPFLGSLPILGSLFRSNNFRRDETELVIVVTPYLVQPVSANRITLPTDGFRTANDGQRILLGETHDSRTGETRPVPTAAQPRTVTPGISAVDPAGVAPQPPVQQAQRASAPALPAMRTPASAQPGFNF